MITTQSLILNSTPQNLVVQDAIKESISLAVQNTHETAYAYLGDSSVSSSNYGFRLKPGATFSVDLNPYDEMYAVGDSGSTVAVIIVER